MAKKRKRPTSRQNKQIMVLEIVLLILLTAAVAVGGVWLYKSMNKKPADSGDSSSQDSSSVLEVIPEDAADTDKLSRNFTYASLDASYKDRGLVCIGENAYEPSKGDLQPVYNAVFDKSGLQIASVADSKLTCRSEMIIPLTNMLNDFYGETGLRTISIERAYDSEAAPPEPEAEEVQPEENDDGGFYDPDGNYITFGYTDEYGNYYDDGYYDSYGNYMGYGYYDADGNYTPYEDMAAANNTEISSTEAIETEEKTSLCGEHADGYSIDLGIYDKNSGKTVSFDGSGDYAWFEENSWRYGFILRYPEGEEDVTGYGYAPAHFRYVGRTAAKVLHDNALTLDELSSFMASYNYDSPLTVNSLDGTAIYYSIADSGLETTEIQVPANAEGEPLNYTVSDTGKGRYLITVILPEEYVIKDGYAEADTTLDSADSDIAADEGAQEEEQE